MIFLYLFLLLLVFGVLVVGILYAVDTIGAKTQEGTGTVIERKEMKGQRKYKVLIEIEIERERAGWIKVHPEMQNQFAKGTRVYVAYKMGRCTGHPKIKKISPIEERRVA